MENSILIDQLQETTLLLKNKRFPVLVESRKILIDALESQQQEQTVFDSSAVRILSTGMPYFNDKASKEALARVEKLIKALLKLFKGSYRTLLFK